MVDVPMLEWSVPSLIDADDLKRCGYLAAFPGQLTVVGSVDPQARDRVAQTSEVNVADLSPDTRYLVPAACLNVYPRLARLSHQAGTVVTSRVTVFRHEDHFEELIRLWEFPVREIVFAGSVSFVRDRLSNAISTAARLAAGLGVDVATRSASDHFFPSSRNRVLEALQLQLQLKTELVTDIGDEHIALASFNYHGTHFSRPYGFDASNEVVTGCVGFGLHRWLAATLRRDIS
jgi:hypothetical protein